MLTRRAVLASAGVAPILVSCERVGPIPRLRAGYVKVLAALPFIYAVNKGLFEKRGVTVEAIEFGNSNDVATAAVTGKIDFIGAGATNAVLDAMTASGKVLQIFTTNNYVKRPNGESTDFLLSLSGYKTIASLKGQPIAFFPGSFGRMFAKLVLPKLGLVVDDVQYVEMQPGQWLAAMQSGAVKAVTALEPFATKIMATIPTNTLVDGYYATVMQGVPGSGSWFAKGKLDQDVEDRISAAMIEAILLISTNRPAANEIVSSAFSLDPALVPKVRMLDWKTTKDPTARRALQQFGAILEQEGGVARKIPANDAWIWS